MWSDLIGQKKIYCNEGVVTSKGYCTDVVTI